VRRVVLSSSRAVYGEGAYLCERCGPVNPGRRSLADLDAGIWVHRCPRCRAPMQPTPTNEDTEAGYTSSYGMTKFFQECIARMEAAQLDTRVLILRYFTVYGPPQSPQQSIHRVDHHVRAQAALGQPARALRVRLTDPRLRACQRCGLGHRASSRRRSTQSTR